MYTSTEGVMVVGCGWHTMYTSTVRALLIGGGWQNSVRSLDNGCVDPAK